MYTAKYCYEYDVAIEVKSYDEIVKCRSIFVEKLPHLTKLYGDDMWSYHDSTPQSQYPLYIGYSRNNGVTWGDEDDKSRYSSVITFEQFVKNNTNEFKLPEKWCVKAYNENVIKYCNEYGACPPYHSPNVQIYAHFPSIDGCTTSLDKVPGYTEITLEEFEEHVFNKDKKFDFKRYILLKDTPNTKALTLFVKDGEFWVPENDNSSKVKYTNEEIENTEWFKESNKSLKLGDYIFITHSGNQYTTNPTAVERYPNYKKPTPSKTGVLKFIKYDIFDSTQVIITEDKFGNTYVYGSQIENNGRMRRATLEEINKDKGELEIEGHKSVIKSDNKVHFGCQSFSKEELLAYKKLIYNSAFNGKITINTTNISVEQLNVLIDAIN